MSILSTGHEIRIDLGNYCNLDCPSCFRQAITKDYNKKHGTNYSYHPYLNNNYVSLKDFETWFPIPFLNAKVNRFLFNGASSEPALNPELFEIIEYLSPHVETIRMSTNGSLKDPNWWHRLGKTKIIPTVSIDSFKENNNLYRINSNSKLIEQNLRAFVAAGGKAVLKMIIFKHNQDEVELFKNLAEELNCSLRVVPAFEFYGDKTSYTVNSKNKTYEIEKNTLYERNNPYNTFTDNPKDYCLLTKDKQFIIHSNGVIYPCCYIEGQFFQVYENFFVDENNTKPNTNIHADIVHDFVSKVERQGGIKSLSLRYNSIETILNSSFFRSSLELSWKTKSNKTCMNCRNWSPNAVNLVR